MENKGLCISCIEDEECSFRRRFPVIYCEEFIGFISTKKDTPAKGRDNYEFTHSRRK